MKERIMVLVMCLGLVSFAACGGSSSSNPEQAAENSYLAMVDIVEYCLGDFGLEADAVGYLVAKQAAETCNCPGGGTLSISDDLSTITAANCKSSGGDNFNGSVTIDDAGLVNGTMTPFGECSTVSANNVGTQSCTGTLTGTCASVGITCTVTDGTGDDCDVTCS